MLSLQEVSLIYADSGAYKLVMNDEGQGKNFVGFVAVEDVPAGHPADEAIVWRGTITKDEWLQVNGDISLISDLNLL